MSGFRDNLVNGLGSGIASAATGAGSSMLGGLIGQIFAKKNAKRQFEYNKQLMSQQFKYQMNAFNAENQRQDYLMQNMPSITKQALHDAGYSAADPNGTGVTTPQTNTMATPNMSFSDPGDYGMSGEFGRNALLQAQLMNINADTMKKTSETDMVKLELQKFRDTYDTQVEQVRQTLVNLITSNRKMSADASISELQYQYDASTFDKRVEQLNVLVDKLKAERDVIVLDASFNAVTFSQRAKKIDKEIEKFDKEIEKIGVDVSIGKLDYEIKKVEKMLADSGVMLNQNWIATIIQMIALGKGDEVGKKSSQFVVDLVGGFAEMIPAIFGQLVGHLIYAIGNLPANVVKGWARGFHSDNSDQPLNHDQGENPIIQRGENDPLSQP